MTRAEARQIITDWLAVSEGEKGQCGYIEGWFYEKDVEAFNMAIEALEQEPCDDMGEVSDGYHTFNQLYHQRAVLFATIVNQNKDKSWKSFRHSDGNYCFDSNGEWFIVGIDTPQGSYTYHYSKEYWNMFDCEELEFGKEWDGHTDEDVTRLLSLEQEPSEDCISREWLLNAFGLSEKTRKYGGDHSGYDTLMLYEIQDVIEDAPSIVPSRATGKWIPVSERLPEEEESVLISTKWDGINMACRMNECWRWDYNNFENEFFPDNEVLAWMPLPEPYKESEEK